VLSELIGDNDIEDFWRKVETNITSGRIRIIIAADSIRPEVRRMIEFLNWEMQNVEVLGLELKVYGDDQDSLVLVPRLIGQTQAGVDRRGSTGETILWTISRLSDYFGSLPEEKRSAFDQVLDWAVEHGCLIESRAQNPTFGLSGKNKERILSIYHNGDIYVFMIEDKYPNGAQDRDELLRKLVSLGMFDPTLNPQEVISGRTSRKSLLDMSENERRELLEVLEEYCG
jgi:hypothetical protein